MVQRQGNPGQDHFRKAVRQAYLADEAKAVRRLIGEVELSPAARTRIEARAKGLVEQLRHAKQPGVMETFLAEYGLSTREGVALMCLAEALLRVPDNLTIDALIRDKIAPADWGRHLGQSGSPMVNASTWALMLTGKVIAAEEAQQWDIAAIMRSTIRRIGDPVIRNAVAQAMRVLGHQFVLGRDIGEAVQRAGENEAKGYTHSYDMLGEAAHTANDASRYFLAYSGAITALAEHSRHDHVRDNPGISVKLSALHPRYEVTQGERSVAELTGRAASLALLAKSANMGINLDAEEADRLDLSLEVIAGIFSNPDLAGWDGFGVVVQAYMPRAPFVIDWLHHLAERHDRRIMVRLVKGAYWDSEIKRAQEEGLSGYPVFTRKVSTDVSFLACARRLLRYSDRLYPQFATHNAHSVAAIMEMAGDFVGFEFQRLHGMGENLFELLRQEGGPPCRIYAPVGVHKDLLAYLVRRLLENGANSSFVHQVLDTAVPAAELVRDPVTSAQGLKLVANPRIPLPTDIYGPRRQNSKGWNLADPLELRTLLDQREKFKDKSWSAAPLVGGVTGTGQGRPVLNPARAEDVVGLVREAGAADVEEALRLANGAVESWRRTDIGTRAACLRHIAELYEAHAPELMALAAREAGKTLIDCIGEIREAVDFCRYYADGAEDFLADGERQGRGVFVCISPWNFPLAIFTGQIVAALVSGNGVIAKPAEQTPLIAAKAVALMHQAGIPVDVLHLLPGDGTAVGGALVSDARVGGVCFTGSTATAQTINRAMAARGDPGAPLIAETGGLNAMIVDSSALPEQAVRDIVTGAFQSAGQRCSALRILFLQRDIAETLLTLLRGAMEELCIGDPWDLPNDIGPVIDLAAKQGIAGHCALLERAGRLIGQTPFPSDTAKDDNFVAPVAFTLQGMRELKEEIFGPVLHVVTFEAEDLAQVIESINEQGYGLTLGIQTRVDSRVQDICDRARVGNIYVNRNQIGAVVGAQPFGGEGLSGTGPKAGGPNYLARFTERAPLDRPTSATSQRTSSGNDRDALARAVTESRTRQPAWERQPNRHAMISAAAQNAATSQHGTILGLLQS
ncbi:MAG: bifunctional proline dehydrogenase/L-glutamate gamma-semialdehyde dehydrogenase PutA, partial [Alphaproteobacteria bacterium]|nr:bifunctional proline dehydrogenase/L-glutamate gamma-semialdehyde dehydrogenase PutA [Alphaproteobacteria bacterium]